MVAILDAAMDGPVTPLVFATAAEDAIRPELAKTKAPVHRLLRHAHAAGRGDPAHAAACARRPGCTASATSSATTPGWPRWSSPSSTTTARASASLEKADVILIAPSRCGKTPTSMYLALQHGLFVANYPLVPEDLESADLPRPVARPRRPLRRADHDRRAAEPGPQRATTRLGVRHRRPVPLGAAPGGPDVRGAPHPGHRLLGEVRRGDGHDDPADHEGRTEGARMSEQSSNVRWFSELGMADLEEVGGKNASLGEMVSQLADLGVRVPNGFATTADAVPPLHRRHRARGADRRPARRPRHRRRTPPGRGRHARSATRSSARSSRPTSRPTSARPTTGWSRSRGERAVVRGPLERHRRGPARRVVRRPAGDLPQRARHRRGAHRDPRGLRLALQRPGHRLPRAPRLRARGRRAVGRRAADGALRHRRVRASCSRWTPSPASPTRCS